MIYRDLLERYQIKNIPALKFFLSVCWHRQQNRCL
jgi:hypothetical protein